MSDCKIHHKPYRIVEAERGKTIERCDDCEQEKLAKFTQLFGAAAEQSQTEGASLEHLGAIIKSLNGEIGKAPFDESVQDALEIVAELLARALQGKE